MNSLKLLKSALCVVCLIFCLASTQAKSVEPIPKSSIIVLDTVRIVPLDIVLYKPNQDIQLAGKVVYSGRNGTDIEYQLFDKNEALIWSKFQEIKSTGHQYDFEFNDINLQGDYNLKINVLNKYGDVLGEGSKDVMFEVGDSFLDIKDLTVLSKPDSLKVGFIFENDKISRKVFPKVEIYRGDKSHSLVKEVKLEQVGLGQKQKKRFTIDIKKDFAPGLYLLEASVISPEGRTMTGVLQSSFFRKGNYVKMNEYEFLLDEYENNKKIGVWFRGRILEDSDELVEAIFELKEGNTILQEKSIPLKIDSNGKFTGNFSFSFSKLLPKFVGILKIKKGDKIIWEERLESPVFKIQEELKPLNIDKEIISDSQEETTSIPIYIYTLGIVIFAFLALLIILHSAKKQTFIWLIFIGIGTLNLNNLFAEDVHTIYWNHPVKEWGFSQNNEAAGFSKMHIEGAIFDAITGNGFFDEIPTETRINFSNTNLSCIGDNCEREYIISSNVTYSDNRTYKATLDLSNIDYDDLSEINSNYLNIRILFKKDDTWYGTPAETFRIVLDSKAPENIDFNYSDESTTNQKTTFQLTCNDSGIGCFDEDKVLTDKNPATPSLSFQSYDIKGNFCNDENKCDTIGARAFEVCDAIGNCTDTSNSMNSLLIDWYDPISPSIGSLNIFENLTSSEGNIVLLKTFENQPISLEYKDPEEIDKDSDENKEDFDTNACGDTDFYVDDGVCKQRVIPCILDTDNYSKRGKKDRSINEDCQAVCPPGYNSDGNYCIRNCTDDRFYPTAMCFGYDTTNDGNGDSFCLDGACPTP